MKYNQKDWLLNEIINKAREKTNISENDILEVVKHFDNVMYLYKYYNIDKIISIFVESLDLDHDLLFSKCKRDKYVFCREEIVYFLWKYYEVESEKVLASVIKRHRTSINSIKKRVIDQLKVSKERRNRLSFIYSKLISENIAKDQSKDHLFYYYDRNKDNTNID